MMLRRTMVFLAISAAAACGDDVVEPITEMRPRDLSAGQERERSPGEVVARMREPVLPGRVVYDPPVNLALQPGDTSITAPFGITAAPDSAARPGVSGTSGGARSDTGQRRQSTPAARDTGSTSPS